VGCNEKDGDMDSGSVGTLDSDGEAVDSTGPCVGCGEGVCSKLENVI
jgi:hypothetical protein